MDRRRYLMLKELYNRSMISAYGQIALLIVATISSYKFFATYKMLPIAIAANFTLILHRIWIGRTTKKISSWYRYFFWNVIVSSTCWSALNFTLMVGIKDDIGMFVMGLLLMSGLTAASTVSLSLSKTLFYIFNTIVLLPGIWGIIVADETRGFSQQSFLVFPVYILFLKSMRDKIAGDFYEIIIREFELNAVINSFPAGLSLIRNGKYHMANRWLVSKFSLNKIKVIGNPIGSQIGDQEFTHIYNSFLNSPDLESTKEVTFSTKEGIRNFIVLLKKVKTDPLEVLVLAIDNEEKKLAEAAKEVHRAQLQASSKMASLGEMAGGIAHEINNPLAIIHGNCSLLSAYLEAPNANPVPEAIKSVKVIKETTERIAKIIKGLRAFSRDSSHEPFVRYSISTIFRDTLAFCEQKANKLGVKLKIDIAEGLECECRPVQISQVLLNLLNNSIDAVSDLNEKWIKLNAQSEGDLVIIKIVDSGAGIDAKIKDKILQPFFTTKPVGKGTGLGLSVSLGIIQSHNGEFYFDHNAANTTVVIKLPKTQVATKQSAA